MKVTVLFSIIYSLNVLIAGNWKCEEQCSPYCVLRK